MHFQSPPDMFPIMPVKLTIAIGKFTNDLGCRSMTRIRRRTEEIRAYILEHISDEGIATKVAEKFDISRQAANKHLKSLTGLGSLVADGKTRKRSYKMAETASVQLAYQIKPGLEEDVVWRQDIRPFLGALHDNVMQVWNYAFTEMFNNAIDHSGGTRIIVTIKKSAVDTEIMILDDGVGIFKKIQNALGLPDEKQAIFELQKGKLTTDSVNHSGQGIFFTSRMVNAFDILSGGVYFGHILGHEEDWMMDRDAVDVGSAIFLKVDNHTARTVKNVYDQYSVNGSEAFNKTVVPVKLASYGNDQLVSRSQAKRVLMRVDRFSQVIFNFEGVDMIGQAFADQIFRVFAAEHPEVQLIPSHANADIQALINTAIKAGRPGFAGEVPAS
jgi:anti-sigma regulatory factor (Ser/Thr protein kinase)